MKNSAKIVRIAAQVLRLPNKPHPSHVASIVKKLWGLT